MTHCVTYVSYKQNVGWSHDCDACNTYISLSGLGPVLSPNPMLGFPAGCTGWAKCNRVLAAILGQGRPLG